MKKLLTYRHGYPGEGYYYVICDVCGKKVRARETQLITDKYNLHKNLIVCKADVDKTNPQTYLPAKTERQISDPKYIRSEGTDVFEVPASSSGARTPGVPRFLTIIEVTSENIRLQWLGPESPGSGAISGYKVERETPVGGGFSTLVSNTGTGAGAYNDESVSVSTQYNYRVSAINKEGTGSPSNQASATTAAS